MKDMKINRNNYEAWLLDYFEGTISPLEEQLLFRFLDDHPDLKADLDDWEAVSLEPEDSTFDHKLALKQSTVEPLELNRHEYLVIKHIEEGLSQAETEEYQTLVNTDATIAEAETIMRQLKVQPDTAIVYDRKGRLKRSRLFPLLTISTLNKAASVGAIAMISVAAYLFFTSPLNQRGQQFAGNEKAKQIVVPTPTPPIIPETSRESSDTRADLASATPQQASNSAIKSTKLPQSRGKLVPLAKLNTRGVTSIEIEASHVNGYEVALNQMMPLYIQSLHDYVPVNLAATETSGSKTPRESKGLVGGGIKLINWLTDKNVAFKKYYNDQGEVVAYKLQSENLKVTHKTKN
ncbi:hypothetical protein DMA11_17870 [Marinilabiliaceae bacterium JC017]|nr:hypothetical protein DMA11_17870 [Marinilabiliaceae bacterium JC017]